MRADSKSYGSSCLSLQGLILFLRLIASPSYASFTGIGCLNTLLTINATPLENL